MIGKPTATIKLDYHLQLFYGSTSGDPVQLKKKQRLFNFVIHNSLEINRAAKPITFKGDDYFTFELARYSDKDTSSGLYHVPEKYFKGVELMLDYFFDMSYTNHIVACSSLQEAIYGFASIHGMPVSDKFFEMLKKRYYRAREECGLQMKKGRRSKKNTHSLSLFCPEIVTI